MRGDPCLRTYFEAVLRLLRALVCLLRYTCMVHVHLSNIRPACRKVDRKHRYHCMTATVLPATYTHTHTLHSSYCATHRCLSMPRKLWILLFEDRIRHRGPYWHISSTKKDSFEILGLDFVNIWETVLLVTSANTVDWDIFSLTDSIQLLSVAHGDLWACKCCVENFGPWSRLKELICRLLCV